MRAVDTCITQEGTVLCKQKKIQKFYKYDGVGGAGGGGGAGGAGGAGGGGGAGADLRNIFKTELFIEFFISMFCIPLL